MQNRIQRLVNVTASYTPLFPARLIGTVTITCPPGNAGTVYFLSDDRLSDVPLIPGEFHRFEQIDLSLIQIKGTVGDIVTVNGGTQ